MFHLRRFFRSVGPGVITGASDDDPSGIITYSQTGAQFGYRFLWLAVLTTPMMIAVQEMSARLGLVTGQGLAMLIRRRYSALAAVSVSLLLFIANTVNIGADLGALAEVSQLVLPGPAWVYVVIYAALIIALEIWLVYKRYVKVLQWLAATLLLYVAVVFVVKVDWTAVWQSTLWPSGITGAAAWSIFVAILGTTISPYLFFWEASEETEEHPRLARPDRTGHRVDKQLQAMRRDTMTGMIYSNVIMFFIIIATAATLHQAGVRDITSAAQAAEALRPLAGSMTFILFTLGIIGTGLLAIPILAGSAGYALAEVLRQPEGLSKTFKQAHAFYLTIAAAVVLGIVLTFLRISPVRLLLIAAVINGILAPIILWFILRLANDRRVIGRHRGGPVLRFFGWATWLLMVGAVLMLGWQFVR